jgi:hypothetical protein
MAAVGFRDLRIVSSAPVKVTEERLKALVPDVNFYSVTFRAFKLPGLEDRAEDFGQMATYTKDSIGLKFDALFAFTFGTPVPVDGNTAMILQSTRYKRDFIVTPPGAHRGLARPEIERGAMGTLALTTRTSRTAKKSEASGDPCCASTSPMPAPSGHVTCCSSASGQDESNVAGQGPCCTPEQKSAAIAAGSKCCGTSGSTATQSAPAKAGAEASPCCLPAPRGIPSAVIQVSVAADTGACGAASAMESPVTCCSSSVAAPSVEHSSEQIASPASCCTPTVHASADSCCGPASTAEPASCNPGGKASNSGRSGCC